MITPAAALAPRWPGFFTNIETVATLSNPAGLHNQESGGDIYLCTGATIPWAQLWPLLRHYG